MPNLIVLTETWITENTLCLCKLNNFQGCHSIRSSRLRVGLVYFVRIIFFLSKIESISVMYEHIETCAVKVNIGQNKYFVFLGQRNELQKSTRFTDLQVILEVYRTPSESEQYFVDSSCTLLTDSKRVHSR